MAFEQTGNPSMAEQQLKYAIALAPRDSAAYIDLGALYMQQHRAEEAIRCFRNAIENNPNDSNSYYNLDVLYQRTGRDELARPLYEKVHALKPGDPDTLLNMTRMRMEPASH